MSPIIITEKRGIETLQFSLNQVIETLVYFLLRYMSEVICLRTQCHKASERVRKETPLRQGHKQNIQPLTQHLAY